MIEFITKYSALIGIFIALISMIVGLLAVHHYRLSRRTNRETLFRKRFMEVRDFIKANRKSLQLRAEEDFHSNNSGRLSFRNHLLVCDDWIPEEPLPLSDVGLVMTDDIAPSLCKRVKRSNSHEEAVVPPSPGYYPSYAEAIKDIDRPGVFENNLQYRLLKVENNRLIYSADEYSYFDKINFGGYLDYEMAQSVLTRQKPVLKHNILKGFREPSQYIVLSGISTLTLIQSRQGLRFLLHSRGTHETASAMNTMHVIPAGEFQPSCKATLSWNDDFDLWKNILRETAEEILLMKEYPHVNKDPFNYKAEPYLTFEKERKAGNIKPYYLGIGLDPSTLQAEILTCVVYREKTFNKIVGADKSDTVLRSNHEGELVHEGDGKWGMEFNDERVKSIIAGNSLSACKAIMQIALEKREFFINCLDREE